MRLGVGKFMLVIILRWIAVTNENVLLFIKRRGIPKEVVNELKCTDHVPPTVDKPFMNRRIIKNVRRIDTVDDALQEFQKKPIAVGLLH